MAAHFSILAWRIPRTEETGGLQSMVLQESGTTEQLNHQGVRWRLVSQDFIKVVAFEFGFVQKNLDLSVHT